MDMASYFICMIHLKVVDAVQVNNVFVIGGFFAAPDASLPEEDGVGNPSSAVAVRMPSPVP